MADQCLIISGKVVCLVYVDDTLLYVENNMEDIDLAIKAIEDAGMHLEVEDDVAGFLGVLIDRKDDGTIHMTQTGLTDRIIKALNIGDLPMKRTPAEYGCLGKKRVWRSTARDLQLSVGYWYAPVSTGP